MGDTDGRKGPPQPGDLRIELRVQGTQPPRGVARAHRGTPDADVPFAGWMGLLRALTQLFGEPVPGPAPPAAPHPGGGSHERT